MRSDGAKTISHCIEATEGLRIDAFCGGNVMVQANENCVAKVGEGERKKREKLFEYITSFLG